MIKIGSLFFLNLMMLGQVFAASPKISVKAGVSASKVALGSSFNYQVSVSADGGGLQVGEPKLPNLGSELQLINQFTGSSTQSTFANGDFVVKRIRNFNYTIAPSKIGKFTLAAAEVVVNGKVFKTAPITVEVTKAGTRNRRARTNQRRRLFDDDDDVFSQLLKRRVAPTVPIIDPDKAFFIEVKTDKKEVFVGESIKAEFYLYSRGQVRDIDTLKYPSLKGFWKEDIHVATRLNFDREVINGEVYLKALLGSYALFPINEGTAVIDEYDVKCTILSGGAFGRPIVSTQKSNRINIKVKPHPGPVPENFTGAVGNFKARLNLPTKNGVTNQPISYKIRFDGLGNAKRITLPELSWPDSVIVYDIISDERYEKNGSSYKTIEILLVPKVAGDLELPARKFSFLNPETGTYYEREIPAASLKISQGSDEALIASATNIDKNKTGKTEPSGPKLPSLALEASSSRHLLYDYGLYFWCFILLVLGLGLPIKAVRTLKGTSVKDMRTLLQERIKKIDQAISQKDWRQAGAEATNAIYFALGESSYEGGKSVQLKQIFKKVPPSVRRELEEPLSASMKFFETLSFAPEELLNNVIRNKNIKKETGTLKKLLGRLAKLGLGVD